MKWWRRVGLFVLLVMGVVGMATSVDACSSFAVYSEEVIYGSNLDWNEASEARFSLRKGAGEIKYFLLEYRLHGVFRGTMGMNNQGVLATLQTVPPIDVGKIPLDKPDLSVQALFDWILQNAATVPQVVEYVSEHSLYPGYGFYLHLHVADGFGNAVVIEADEDGTKVLPAGEDFSIMTNFYANRYPGLESSICPRYQIAETELEQKYSQFDTEAAFDLLYKLRQYSTRVSMVYLPEEGLIQLALGGDYDQIWLADLTQETLRTYRGFTEEQEFPLNYSGVTTRKMGYTYGSVIKPEIHYTLEPEAVKSYLGRYQHSDNSSMVAEIFIEDQMMYLEVRGTAPLLLVPEADDEFNIPLAFAKVRFVRSQQGEVTSLVLEKLGQIVELAKI